MTMAGAGRLGRRGKFSKTKEKKGSLPKFNTVPQINIKDTSLVIMSFGATSLVLTSKTALKNQLQGVPGGAAASSSWVHKLANLPSPPALLWLPGSHQLVLAPPSVQTASQNPSELSSSHSFLTGH